MLGGAAFGLLSGSELPFVVGVASAAAASFGFARWMQALTAEAAVIAVLGASAALALQLALWSGVQ